MSSDKELRRAADRLNVELAGVAIPPPPLRQRRGLAALIVAAVFTMVVVGAVLVLAGGDRVPLVGVEDSTTTSGLTLRGEDAIEPEVPQRVGPEVVIAEGIVAGSDESWRLTAFLTEEEGLCMRLRGQSCGPLPGPSVPLSAASTTNREVPEPRLSCAFGALAPEVVEVFLVFSDGSTLSPPLHDGGEIPAKFYAHCWSGDLNFTSVTVRDADGSQLASTGETIYGVWELIELNGNPPVREAFVTFSVQPDQANVVNSGDEASRGLHSVSGNAGCNSFSGALGINGDRLFAVSVFRTLMGCRPDEIMQQEEALLALVGEASWAVNGGQLTLTGLDGIVAVLGEVATNGAVGVWRLSDLDGESLETPVSLTFRTDNRFSGYAGCWFTGEYEIETDVVSVSGLPPTPTEDDPFPPELLCDNLGDQEQRFLELIENATGRVDGNQLILENQNGAVAVFSRA